MAMSANAVLMKFFKLPPAMRMILALAGFGSLATILFRVLPMLRTRQGQMWVLIIGGIGLVLFLIIWGIRKMVWGKKSAQLSGALESQGPTRGDIAEQEQIYREKFRNKLSELKTNGLSVYKLPWFMLIGEPGCGKTASLIHSGLDFPLGKDEVPGFGGTRNYNWWFTNEAVLLDTAGRIAFHEEGTTDKVEWEYFCKLIKQNRTRCPINGMVIALPADKLLRDSADERTQKATVLRERLRQIHQLLGVRFPTFVLVTKMDLVGGFNEFFEEIRVDLAQRNQMFGWSRPDEFQEPYDASKFPEAFDTVSGRLRDWAMRYLQRKATEDELGMIVTFPEAFRQLRAGLNDYIGTIFQKSPLLEPPFFRGFYFTSAVQEGAPILDVFARTSTHRVSERPTKAVDSKAFFIHDLYTKKVFPEQGLVFRSAKHVSLNKRMRRMVWVGSAAMFLLMIGMFAIGWAGTRKLIDNPKADCKSADELITQNTPDFKSFADNLALAGRLNDHYKNYSGGWNALYARSLFIFANISTPQRYVGAIHSRFVLDYLVTPVLHEAERRFDATDLQSGLSEDARKRYMEALRVYTQWYGEVVGGAAVEPLAGQLVNRRREFDALLRFVITESEQDRVQAGDQFDAAMALLARDTRVFGRDVLGKTAHFATGEENVKRATATIVNAAQKITDYWRRLAEISDKNQHNLVRYWAEFTNLVAALRERYREITNLATTIGQPDGYEPARQDFLRLTAVAENLGDPKYSSDPGTLKRALDDLANFLSANDPPQRNGYIIRLGQLLGEFQQQWNVEYEPLINALKTGAPDETATPQAEAYSALHGGQTSLADSFNASLKRIRDKLGLDSRDEPLDYYVAQRLVTKNESQEGLTIEDGTASVSLDPRVFGPDNEFQHYLLEMRKAIEGEGVGSDALNDLRQWPGLLQGIASGAPEGEYLSIWFGDVKSRSPDRKPDKQLVIDHSKLQDRPFWRPADLYELSDQMWIGRRSVSVEGVLGRMVARADETTRASELPGLAQLLPGFQDPPTPALPFNRHKYNSDTPTVEPALRTPAPEPTPAQPEQPSGGLPRLGAQPAQPTPAQSPPAPAETVVPDARRGAAREQELMLAYHTRSFLSQVLSESEKIKQLLASRGPEGQAVMAALDRAADKYIDGYFRDWHELSGNPKELLDQDTLELLERCRDGQLTWPTFVQAVSERYRNIGVALGSRMEALCDHSILYSLAFPPDGGPMDAAYTRVARWHDTHRDVSLAQEQAAMFQNLPPDGGAAASKAFGGAISGAWNQYVNQVAALGPLTGETRSLQPPDLDKFRTNVVYRQAYRVEFPLARPLVDLTDYGQELLKHHVQAELAKVFAEHANKYPLVSSATVDGYDYGSFVSRSQIPPTAFLDLLRKAEAFRTKFLALYENLEPGSGAQAALAACEAWTRFLYDNPADLLADRPPSPCPVWLVVVAPGAVERQSYASMGIGYLSMEISVPLLTASRTRPEPIRIETKTTAGDNAFKRSVTEALAALPGPNYSWSLMDSSSVLPESFVKLGDRNPAMKDRFPETADGFKLGSGPWTIPMLLGARSNNKISSDLWQIPVSIQAGEPVGCVIGIKLGRPFPGTTIPPLQYSGAAPKMSAASRYLSGN